MAGRKRSGGHHRMTPARRAALRKAQLASARKRRGIGAKAKGFARGAGAVGATVGSVFVAYHTQEYIAKPNKLVRHTRKASSSVAGFVGKTAKKAAKKSAPKPVSTDWSKFGYL